MATDAQYYKDGIWSGDEHAWSGDEHAAYLQEMADKYPHMSRRIPNGVEVLTEEEYREKERQNEQAKKFSYAQDDGYTGGPFSSLRRRT